MKRIAYLIKIRTVQIAKNCVIDDGNRNNQTHRRRGKQRMKVQELRILLEKIPVSLAVSGGLSREALYAMQEMVLLSELKTSDVKQIALEEAERLTDDREKKWKGTGKNDNRWYELEEEINELCAVVLMISVALAEPEEGIKFYFKHAQNSTREITLYCALQLMDWVEEEELWIKVYEYGLSKKIRPREGLRESYERRQKENAGKTEEDI